jgi:GTP pyrophosphokinase
MADMVVRFAQCCHPIPGDPIVGFITQGRGVSIHRKNCSNLKYMGMEPGRTVHVAWEDMKGADHTLQLFVLARDRERLLVDLLQVFYDNNAVVKGTEARLSRDSMAESIFTVYVKDKEHLQDIVRKLEKVKDVVKVSRKGTI